MKVRAERVLFFLCCTPKSALPASCRQLRRSLYVQAKPTLNSFQWPAYNQKWVEQSPPSGMWSAQL